MMTVSINNKNKDFFENVFDVVRLVPTGKVTSYGAIAKYLGMPRSSRMVGWAMNTAHDKLDVPAHRVVNRNGLLSGKMHFSPPEKMQIMLESEGIEIMKDQVVDFKTKFWNPSEELKL